MAVKTQSVSLPTGLLQTHTHTHARIHLHRLWLMSFHRGQDVTVTLPTVKHECESTHFTACVMTHTYVNAQYANNEHTMKRVSMTHRCIEKV